VAGHSRRLVSNTVSAEAEPHEPIGRRWWVFLAPLVVVALAASFVIPSVRHQWALSVFRQPTRYTALSFSHSWALPAVISAYQPIKLSFTINNQEGQTEHYHYIITQTSAGVSSTLAKSAKAIVASRSATVSTVIRPSCLVSPCRIKVSLPGYPETIDFLASARP
jgi:hypothetical protein